MSYTQSYNNNQFNDGRMGGRNAAPRQDPRYQNQPGGRSGTYQNVQQASFSPIPITMAQAQTMPLPGAPLIQPGGLIFPPHPDTNKPRPVAQQQQAPAHYNPYQQRVNIEELVQVPPELATFASDPQFQQILLRVKEQTMINYVALNRGANNEVESIRVDAPSRESAQLARGLIETHFKLQSRLKNSEMRLQKVQTDLFSAQGEIASGMMIEFNIDPELVGLVLGKKGARIKQIEQETKVHSINVTGESGRIMVTGPDSASVQRARELLELVEGCVPLESHQIEWLSNKYNSATLNDIKTTSDLIVARVNQEKFTLDIVGTVSAVRNAKFMLPTQMEYVDKQIEIEANERQAREKLSQVRKQYGIKSYGRDGVIGNERTERNERTADRSDRGFDRFGRSDRSDRSDRVVGAGGDRSGAAHSAGDRVDRVDRGGSRAQTQGHDSLLTVGGASSRSSGKAPTTAPPAPHTTHSSSNNNNKNNNNNNNNNNNGAGNSSRSSGRVVSAVTPDANSNKKKATTAAVTPTNSNSTPQQKQQKQQKTAESAAKSDSKGANKSNSTKKTAAREESPLPMLQQVTQPSTNTAASTPATSGAAGTDGRGPRLSRPKKSTTSKANVDEVAKELSAMKVTSPAPDAATSGAAPPAPASEKSSEKTGKNNRRSQKSAAAKTAATPNTVATEATSAGAPVGEAEAAKSKGAESEEPALPKRANNRKKKSTEAAVDADAAAPASVKMENNADSVKSP